MQIQADLEEQKINTFPQRRFLHENIRLRSDQIESYQGSVFYIQYADFEGEFVLKHVSSQCQSKSTFFMTILITLSGSLKATIWLHFTKS